jgi:transposase
MAYSLDFRRRVMKIKEEESLTFEMTAKRLKVNIRTLFRWAIRISPKIKRQKPATKIDMKKLRGDVAKHPDAYQYERAERFGVSQWGIGKALGRLKLTYKKNSDASQG